MIYELPIKSKLIKVEYGRGIKRVRVKIGTYLRASFVDFYKVGGDQWRRLKDDAVTYGIEELIKE